MRAESITCAHWEELLKSVSDFIFSKHYLRIPIQGSRRYQNIRKIVRNPKLPISRSTIHPSLSKIAIFYWILMHFLTVFDYGWMINLTIIIFEFLEKFLIFWHPWHPWGCIRSVCWKWNLKQIEAIPPSVR